MFTMLHLAAPNDHLTGMQLVTATLSYVAWLNSRLHWLPASYRWLDAGYVKFSSSPTGVLSLFIVKPLFFLLKGFKKEGLKELRKFKSPN
jgi:hypothetical protein